MNIFAFAPSPELSALWLDDKRKNKMIIESCQLMSTVVNIMCRKSNPYDVYNTAFVNHPCTRWASKSKENMAWLHTYTLFLLKGWGSEHACSDIWREVSKFLKDVPDSCYPTIGGTEFPNCAANQSLGISYKHITNVHAAYRLYIRDRWATDQRQPTWNKGERPWWA